MTTDPRTVETYNAAAEVYDAHISNPADSPLHTYYEKPAMRAELPDLTDLSVLSIGCGSGVDAHWLKEHGAGSVSGVDISVGLIGVAQQKYPDIDFRVMDMAKLEFPDESFDLAYSSLAIHYLPDWGPPLREARRILRPNGQFIFSCNHPVETSLEYSSNERTRGAYLGRTIMQDTEARQIHGDYLAADHEGVRQTVGTVATEYTVRNYHRPFSKMIESILASGFTIKKLVEPLPQEEMKRDNLEHYKQVLKIPKFAIWVLEK
jgi:ubiquinone/menaquinone biosynthesis C-methylase UbiE